MTGFKEYIGSAFMPFILPIIPAGARLSPHSRLDQAKVGKIPGHKTGDGWMGFTDWQKFTARPRSLELWPQMYTEDGLPETIGLQAEELPACDIDVDDEYVAKLIAIAATIWLGPAPKRTRPKSNRLLLQYRIKRGAAPIGKRRLAFKHPEQPDKVMAVEILGKGQQYLIEGKHPTGVLYEWEDGKGPLQWGHERLTEVDNNVVNAFLKIVRDLLINEGYELVKGASATAGGGALSAERHPIGPDHPDQCPDLALLADLLKACPCDAPQFDSRDDWIAALCAIKAACAGDHTFYEDHVWPWCEAYADNEEDDVRGVWESIRDSSLGWSYLVSVAGDFDWGGIAQMFEKLDWSALDDDASSDRTAPLDSRRSGPIPKLMPADFALHKLPRREFVIGNRFMAGVVTLGVGPPGSAKSTLAISTALSIATGERLTGEVVHRTGRVWIHNNEDSRDELYRRIGGTLECHGIEFNGVRDNIFVTSGLDEPLVVAVKEKDLVKRTAAVAEVIASIRRERIIHIVVDPFVSTHRGVTENSNEEIEQVADAFRQIANETGCSVDLIHHSHKAQNEAGDMNAARGASSLIGAVRMIYTITPMSAKTAKDMEVPADQVARLVRLDHAKGNYSARDGRIRWFELESYNIGNGTDINEEIFCNGDTIAVPKLWSPATAASPPNLEPDREAERRDKLQRVRDLVAATMPSDRCRQTEILPAIKREFVIEDSAAHKLLKEAIPEGAEAVAQAHGRTYSLRVERDGPSAPHPIIIVRQLISLEAEAA